jgi:branched-chain amino acid transport system substrate-binding protein
MALRNALEQLHDVVGADGVYNMSASNHNGLDARARVLVTVRAGAFIPLQP